MKIYAQQRPCDSCNEIINIRIRNKNIFYSYLWQVPIKQDNFCNNNTVIIYLKIHAMKKKFYQP
ncbi:hypothetical protein M153_4950005135 [Pseudoloma neurophilia]|uniref:Uncharacterized protein n=1 Tax=Pseudoloma neurophilia TaxID=146866 RepID=A0A0R0LX52_9MICR|nr:hypothetical protein M153_4950005135 [Pseudoloma neurophilia]